MTARLSSSVVPAGMSLAELLEATAGEFDSLVLQVQGRSVELGLVRKLHALMEQAAGADRLAVRLREVGL